MAFIWLFLGIPQHSYLSLNCLGRCPNSVTGHIPLSNPICMTSEELLISLCLYFELYQTYTYAEGATILMDAFFSFAVHKHLVRA